VKIKDMDEKKAQAIFGNLLDRACTNLQEYDKLISAIREVMDRINVNQPKTESNSSMTPSPPSAIENTVVNRFNMFNDSLQMSNNKLRELYNRLSELA
jgi:hypothetical protein